MTAWPSCAMNFQKGGALDVEVGVVGFVKSCGRHGDVVLLTSFFSNLKLVHCPVKFVCMCGGGGRDVVCTSFILGTCCLRHER